jgi:hypothetical protein
MFQWLKAADDKGIQVIFVADSCHSGSMHRSARARGVKFRNGNFERPQLNDDLLKSLPPPAIARMTEKDLKHVTFVAATQEDKLTPEVIIDGRPRGALSWAFARALEGAADTNKDGQLTQVELIRFLVPKVHQQVESQQTPEVRPLRPRSQPIVSVAQAPQVATPTTGGSKLRLAILNAQGPHLSAISGYAPVTLVSEAGNADLVWDAKTGRVEHKLGGKVADGMTAATIRGVLAKFATLKLLKARAHPAPVNFEIVTGNQRYAPGSRVRIKLHGAQFAHLTLFNLAPNGRVEFFIPTRTGEAKKDWRGKALIDEFEVKVPPYGAEHLVAIFTEGVQAGLHSVLARMKIADQAHDLPAVLAEFLKGVKYQIGVAGIYTGKED